MALFLALFCITLLSSCQMPTYTKSFTQDEIQQKVEEKFPVQKEKIVFKVVKIIIELSNPEVYFLPIEEQKDRMGVDVDLSVDLPGLPPFTVETSIDGEIDYNGEKGEIYFRDPQVNQLGLKKNLADQMPERLMKYQDDILIMANSAAKVALEEIPVFTFDESLKQKFAQAIVKDIVIEGEKLNVIFGLP